MGDCGVRIDAQVDTSRDDIQIGIWTRTIQYQLEIHPVEIASRQSAGCHQFPRPKDSDVWSEALSTTERIHFDALLMIAAWKCCAFLRLWNKAYGAYLRELLRDRRLVRCHW